MEIDATTVIFEIINFVVLMALLARFLFKPVRTVLRERKDQLERAANEAKAAHAESEVAKRDYEQRRRELDVDAAAQRDAARQAGEAAARQLVDQARDEMHRAREALDAELERARGEAVERLAPDLVALGVEASRRVLSEMGAKDVAVAFARRGAVALVKAMAEGDRDAPIEARVSPDADVYAVSLALEEQLGDRQVSVVVDPALCGGVRLSAGGLEVESSAGASLGAWFRQRTAAHGTVVGEVAAS